MTGKLRSAFDGIRAENSLKSGTVRFLCDEIQKRGKTRPRTALRGYAAALACAVILLLSGTFAYNIYITPAAYVDVDVNPSIELILNRFDRVIGAHAYNDDGVSVLDGLPVTRKSFGDALVMLMDAIAGQGYLQNDGLVSVTLQTDDGNREGELLADIYAGIEGYMTLRHCTAQIDVFPVSGALRSHSHEQGVSPAMYLAIQELIAVDPTASVERCRGHSISELKELAREHGGHHGRAGGAADSAGSPADGGNHYAGGAGGHHGGHD